MQRRSPPVRAGGPLSVDTALPVDAGEGGPPLDDGSLTSTAKWLGVRIVRRGARHWRGAVLLWLLASALVVVAVVMTGPTGSSFGGPFTFFFFFSSSSPTAASDRSLHHPDGAAATATAAAAAGRARVEAKTTKQRLRGHDEESDPRHEEEGAAPSSEDEEDDDEESDCTIWIAPSSVRGVNGYGIFTTRNLQAGESILGGPDGVAVPVEPYLHHDLPGRDDRKHFLGLFGEYMWGRGIPDHSTYEANRGFVLDYQIGFGSLPNHHCVLSYLDILYPDPPYVDSLADRFADPSAGAFSYNRGREFIVTSPLRAGDEIFLNYGYCDRAGQSPAWTQRMYVTQDFQDAANLIQQHLRQPASSQLYHSDTGQLVVPPETTELVASLLPQSQQAMTALYSRYTYSGTALTREVAQQSLNRQTPESIRATGVCLDNLVARQSTLTLAGQGGFAQRRIRAGRVITPAPFLHVMSKESLDVYSRDGLRNGTQLLINYCWGHGESSILLCPNTNAVMINHCSSRTHECGPDGPNAAYRWASDPVTNEWLAMSVEELRHQSGRGLAMEVVALRDIQPGEEVFLDYGIEWEEAWMAHVARWRSPSRPPGSWISARDANDKQGPILDALVARNVTETIDHPYLFTGCVYWATDWDFHQVYQQQGLQWQDTMPEDELLRTFSDPGGMFMYPDPARGYGHHPDRMHWPCTVLRPEDDVGSTYLVRIHQPPWWSATNQGATPPWHVNKLPRLLRGYPRSSIHYFVHPYASDQHLPGVFRHELRIRDDIFPTQWKNVAGAPR